MIKKILTCVFLLAVLIGCSKCLLIRSEYYDITGKVLQPKSDDAPVELYEMGQEMKRPSLEIGSIRVIAQHGTTKEALKREIIRRARAAGADAVVEIEFAEDKENKLPICGKFLSTKRNTAAIGRAVVFTDKKNE